MRIGDEPLEADAASRRAGTVALVLGILFVVATAVAYVLSLSDLVDPPNWVRAMGLVWLPVGLIGVPVAYAGARTGAGRYRGRAGVVLLLAGVLGFVVLEILVG